MPDFCPFRASVPPLDASLGRGRKNGAGCAPQKNGVPEFRAPMLCSPELCAPEPHAPTLCSPKLRTSSPAPRPLRLSTAPRRHSSQAARTEKSFYPVFLSVRERPHSKAPGKEDAPLSKKAENCRKRLADHARKASSAREERERNTAARAIPRERMPAFFRQGLRASCQGQEATKQIPMVFATHFRSSTVARAALFRTAAAPCGE